MVGLRPKNPLGKQRNWRKGNKKSCFDEIPKELVTSVIALVGSSSISDLCNAKLSCKTLRSIGDDSYVLKHATLEKLPVIPWPLKGSNIFSQISFVELCQKSGNPEALYRKGVVDYFSGERKEYALECLEVAKESGHLASSYAIGIILILTGEMQKGMQQLGKMKNMENLTTEMAKCRDKLKSIIGNIWSIKREEILRDKPTCCSLKYQHMYRKGWCLADDEKHIECEACLCDIEIDCIYDSLSNKLI